MKAIKNYSILIISTIILMFSGCSFASHTKQPVEPDPIVVNDDDNQNSYVSNPWTEVTKADVEEGLGIEINLPDDAQKSLLVRIHQSTYMKFFLTTTI